MNLRSVTKGTKYDAPQSTRDTISTMLQGDEWMIVPDASEGGKLHWDQVSLDNAQTLNRAVGYWL